MLNMLNQDNAKVILAAAFEGVEPLAAMQRLMARLAVANDIEFADKLRIKALVKGFYRAQFGVDYWGANPQPRRRAA